MPNLDWNDLRVFLTLVRTGSAYDASRLLNVDHTTVRRRVRALEVALDTSIVEPSRNNLVLTENGKLLAHMIETIDRNVAEITNSVSDEHRSLAGKVRVGTPDGVGAFFIAPKLAQLHQAHPQIELEVFITSRQFNVASREAEIAVVISHPPSSRHLIRKLGTAHLRLFASADYLGRARRIRSLSDLAGHDFIGYPGDQPFIPAEVSALSEFENFRHPTLASNSVVSQISLSAAGGGICLMPRYMSNVWPQLEPILHDEVVVPVDFYLLIHADLSNLARHRLVADFLIESVANEPELFE